jgi:serine phosphatase RsbU (regulator of sigma subunit)
MVRVRWGPEGSDVWGRLLAGPGPTRTLLGLGIAASGVGAAAIIGVTADIADSQIRPGMALVVLAAALVGGLWPALAATIGGFAVYELEFVDREGGFWLSGGEILVLVTFLAVAIVVANLEAAGAAAGGGRKRLAFLAEANDLLSSSLDLDRTLGAVARLAVPGLADWCAIHTFNPDGTELRVEVAHADPEMMEEVRDLAQRYPPDLADRTSPLTRVLSTGQPVFIPRVTDELLRGAARDEEHLRRIRALGLRSAIIVPLQARGRVVGAMTMATAGSRRRYRRADVAFMEQLARSAATAMENARLYRESTAVAQTLQRSLLPADLPDIPGVEVAARYRAATEGTLVGGDFYDLFETGRGDWVTVVGDVCGKGAEAAALTGLVRHTIRAVSVREQSPSRVLRQVNRQILRGRVDRFCTAMVGRIRPNEERVRFTVSCAGHPAPLVYRPGRTVESTDCEGTLLGVFGDPELVDRSIELNPGDTVVLYTDGVVERFERAGRGGDAHLVSLLWESQGEDAQGIADRIYRDAAMSGSEVAKDDLAVVVLRVRPHGSGAEAT